MAPTKKCWDCGETMYIDNEEKTPKGTYVTYICRTYSCRNSEKVFIDD